MNELTDQIEMFHEKSMKMTVDELSAALLQASMKKMNPKAILIIKTYLLRALQREGIK